MILLVIRTPKMGPQFWKLPIGGCSLQGPGQSSVQAASGSKGHPQHEPWSVLLLKGGYNTGIIGVIQGLQCRVSIGGLL